MKFDLEQVFLFGLFDVLGLFAVWLEILAHFVSPGTHPIPTSFSCSLVIVICVLWCPPAGNYRNQCTDQQLSKPSQTWLQFWDFLNLECPLEICPNHDLHFLGESSRWHLAKVLVKSCCLRLACRQSVAQSQSCFIAKIKISAPWAKETKLRLSRKSWRDFPGTPVVETLCFTAGAWIWSLVMEPRPPCCVAEKEEGRARIFVLGIW